MWILTEEGQFLNANQLQQIQFVKNGIGYSVFGRVNHDTVSAIVYNSITPEEKDGLVKALVFAIKMRSAIFSVDEWRRGKYRVPATPEEWQRHADSMP